MSRCAVLLLLTFVTISDIFLFVLSAVVALGVAKLPMPTTLALVTAAAVVAPIIPRLWVGYARYKAPSPAKPALL